MVALGVLQLEAVGPTGSSESVIDEGSDTTLVREGLANSLSLDGRYRDLTEAGVGGAQVRNASRRVKLQLRSADGELVTIEGSTLPTVTRPVGTIDWSRIKGNWTHLADLPLKASGGRIDILLGLDQAHLMMTLETRNGRDDKPMTSRTRTRVPGRCDTTIRR